MRLSLRLKIAIKSGTTDARPRSSSGIFAQGLGPSSRREPEAYRHLLSGRAAPTTGVESLARDGREAVRFYAWFGIAWVGAPADLD